MQKYLNRKAHYIKRGVDKMFVINKIYYAEIAKELEPFNLSQTLNLVSYHKRQKFNISMLNYNMKLSVYAEILLRYLLCDYLGVRNEDLIILNNSYGKPYLKNHTNIDFNISHTKNAVTVVISDKPVGIDIEIIANENVLIARRFFTKNEFDYVYKCHDRINERFFEIWTKKEAFIKCAGQGLSIPLQSFDIFEHEQGHKSIVSIKTQKHIISICGEREYSNKDIVRITEREIMDMACLLL